MDAASELKNITEQLIQVIHADSAQQTRIFPEVSDRKFSTLLRNIELQSTTQALSDEEGFKKNILHFENDQHIKSILMNQKYFFQIAEYTRVSMVFHEILTLMELEGIEDYSISNRLMPILSGKGLSWIKNDEPISAIKDSWVNQTAKIALLKTCPNDWISGETKITRTEDAKGLNPITRTWDGYRVTVKIHNPNLGGNAENSRCSLNVEEFYTPDLKLKIVKTTKNLTDGKSVHSYKFTGKEIVNTKTIRKTHWFWSDTLELQKNE